MLIVKIGGGHDLNLPGLCEDIGSLLYEDASIVLVHGGAATTDDLAVALGHPPEYVTSPSGHISRRTDRRTLEIFEMAYCGQINKGFVERLQAQGVNALGLSGLDGGLWRGPRKSTLRIVDAGRTRVLRDDFTGKVEHVNTALLVWLLQTGYVPVLTPPALSYDNEAVNVDGDRAAAATAAALSADTLVLLTSAPGLLRDFPDESSLVPRLGLQDLDAALKMAQGKMKRKVLAAQEALVGGVPRVIIADGRRTHPLQRALDGAGTTIGHTVHAAPAAYAQPGGEA